MAPKGATWPTLGNPDINKPVFLISYLYKQTGMSPHMSLQQPRPGKRLPTDLAFAGESVGSDVHP